MFSVFENINRFAGRSKALDFFAVFCARALIYVLVLALLVLAVIAGIWRLFLFPVFSGIFAGLVVDWLIYRFYKKQRPAKLEGTTLLIKIPRNPSFPSRHASISFGMSFYLFFYSWPIAIFFVICSCFIGISRVFCGVHWFKDILAGAAVGLLSAIIIYSIFGL